MEAADRAFGIAPSLQRPIADLSGKLGTFAQKRAAHVITEVERRFPQLSVLSVGELLAKAIRFTHSDQSVSSLFE